nr:EOG090X07TK [Megafenestra aurita]
MSCPDDIETLAFEAASKHTDEDEDKGVTLVEVLEEEAQLEEDANAVLGGSDDTNCTYTSGYVKRQALYACVTCRQKSEDTSELAGICLACSYHCHDGHELVELYTKRNFCCDCGNSKFPSNPCTLTLEKAALNDKNQYNHNFMGQYCTCQKPYPDPEDANPDEMVQCVICEDWLHNKHLGRSLPPDEDYSEMICDGCMEKNTFLNVYAALDSFSDTTNPVSSCKLENKSDTELLMTNKKATFWPEGWRTRLCRCQKCLAMYEEKKIVFLTDEQDTVEYYEQKGKNDCVNRPSSNDRLMTALSSLDRVQQVEAITEYQSFSAELKEYLKTFADNKRIVREEDITEFFGRLKERKRRRLDDPTGGMPHFCR